MEPNGVGHMASGDVRFTFRSDETDVNVTIEGKRAWVESLVEELGLSEVGTMLPIGIPSCRTALHNPLLEMMVRRTPFFLQATWGLNLIQVEYLSCDDQSER